MTPTARRFVTAAFVSMVTAATFAGTTPNADIDIPFQKFVLANGLTLIVHEDAQGADRRRQRLVPRRLEEREAGQDRLRPSLRASDVQRQRALQRRLLQGARARRSDRPATAPPTPIAPTTSRTCRRRRSTRCCGSNPIAWATCSAAIDQAKLDEQRGVVQNEKRQGENQPYGRVFTTAGGELLPAGPPLLVDHHRVDGRSRRRQPRGRARVVSQRPTAPPTPPWSIAGDVRADEVRERVEHYFGDIPAGPPLVAAQRSGSPSAPAASASRCRTACRRRGSTRAGTSRAGAPPRPTSSASPPTCSPRGKSSRLYRRLVYEDQIASDVAGFVMDARDRGPVHAPGQRRPWRRPGTRRAGDRRGAARAFSTQVRLPTSSSASRPATERSSCAAWSASAASAASPTSWRRARSTAAPPTPIGPRSSASPARLPNRWSTRRAPGSTDGELTSSWSSPIPTTRPPSRPSIAPSSRCPTDFPAGVFPRAERRTLSNGLEVLVVERRAVPVVRPQSAARRRLHLGSHQPGRSRQSGHGHARRGHQRSARRSRSATSSPASERRSRRMPSSTSAPCRCRRWPRTSSASLDLFADVILRPAFAADEVERRKKQRIAAIQREKAQPVTMALRVLPRLLYGEEHAYGLPFTGSGTEDSVAAITRDVLLDYHRTWFKPGNATLIVVGATTADELVRLLEPRLAGWQPGSAPARRSRPSSRESARRSTSSTSPIPSSR